MVSTIFLGTEFALASSPRSVGVALSIGVPDLINFQAQYLKIGWLRFGYGLGTQPIKKIVEKYTKLDPNKFIYKINETYEIIPKIDFSIRAFNAFIRLFPGTNSFYIEGKYSTWKVEASIEGIVHNILIDTSASAGRVSFRIIQPMLGTSLGFQFIGDSGFFTDFGFGVSYLFRTAASYQISGLIGNGLQSSVLSPEISEQVKKGQEQVNLQINNALTTMRNITTFVPIAYFTLGWAF